MDVASRRLHSHKLQGGPCTRPYSCNVILPRPCLGSTRLLGQPLGVSWRAGTKARVHAVCEANPPAETKSSAKAAKNSYAKQLWANSAHVQMVGVDQAEDLYLSLVQRTNEQHVLMVMWAPWCPYCQTVEAEVERLAAGLSHESSLTVVALNTDPAAARYFAKEVLGVHTLPSFVLFPAGSRTFFKYKGRGRDANSLLKFLNMVCNQSQDHTWQLDGQPKAITAVAPLPSPGPSTGGLAATLGAAQAPITALAMAFAGFAVLGKVLVARSKAREAMAAAQSGTAADGAAAGEPLQHRINTVMGTMGVLMVKLAGAKVQLGVLEAQMAAQGIKEGAQASAADTATVMAADVDSVNAVLPSSQAASASAAAAIEVTEEQLRSSALPGQAEEARLTGSEVAVENGKLSSEELLAMLDTEGGDVDKVVQRLLARNITLEDLPLNLPLEPITPAAVPVGAGQAAVKV